MNNQFADQLEKNIISKINAIEKAKSPEERKSLISNGNINSSIKRLKQYDIALAEKLSRRYFDVVSNK